MYRCKWTCVLSTHERGRDCPKVLIYTSLTLLLSFIFFSDWRLSLSRCAASPLLHRYALCTVLIAWSWHHFPCHFSEIFSRPLLAAQVACYFYSLRAGSLYVFASFQSGANNRGWQENRGNTLLIWPIPYTLWMVFAADGAPCAVWAFSESLWLWSSTPHFERMTHYVGTQREQQSWDQFEHLNTARMKTSQWITCKRCKPPCRSANAN